MVQCVAVCCSTLRVAMLLTKLAAYLCCSLLQLVAACCGVLRVMIVYCSVLQCDMLQCDAMCCSVLQCVAGHETLD